MAGRLACACWVIWSFIVILITQIPARAESILRIAIATVHLTSLVVFKVKTFLVIFRFSHSVTHETNSRTRDVQRMTMRDRKVLVDTRFTLVTSMVLFIPTCVLSVVRPPGFYSNAVFPWSMTITLLSSSVNPVIHLWRNRQLRKAVVKLFWPFER